MSEILGYQPTSEPDSFVATLGSGARVRVHRSRARSYPGLPGDAPPTGTVYRAIARALGDRHSVLDIGSGSGAGARVLLAPGRAVSGVDPSDEAIAFARAFAPRLVLHHAPVEALRDAGEFDAVTVVDVLGQVPAPATILAAAHRLLAPGGAIFVAELRAGLSRTVVAPERRGFALEPLEAALVRAGFRPDGSFATPAEIVALRAHHAPDARVAPALAECALAAPSPGAVDRVAATLEDADDPIEARELLLGFGALHLTLGDPDSAAGSFVGALRLFPNSARGLVGLGTVAERVERPRDAVRLYERAVRADESCALAWRALAAVRASLQDDAGAAEALANAERLEPSRASTPPASPVVARSSSPGPLPAAHHGGSGA